jgi:protocatechuate 3,4-dioxygenase, alpha subunit
MMSRMSRDPARFTATPSQTVGPFFHFGLADNPSLGVLAGEGVKGTRIRLHVRVLDGDRQPVPDALVEIWQADADGQYVHSAADGTDPPRFTGFGRLPTTADGTCVFETILPGRVAGASGAAQAPHINVCLFSRGLLRQLYTRIYFAGTEGLESDPILSAAPVERRETLLARSDTANEWRFDIQLQGERETVFFDL